LARTRGEVVVLRELLERAKLGDSTVMEQLEHLAHRIHGTGATFGFAAVSECGAEIEHLAEGHRARDVSVDAAVEPQRLQHLMQCAQRLAQEVEIAAAS
jgi:chemotaxis protein histidine kinase CheA